MAAATTSTKASVLVNEETGETGIAYKIDDRVKVKIEYPKDYKKAKHFKDGETVLVHRLTADTYVEKGIGKIVAE